MTGKHPQKQGINSDSEADAVLLNAYGFFTSGNLSLPQLP